MATVAKKPPSDECRWICLYPAYINAKKTLAEGRRISKLKAVDNPTCQEMFDILKNAGFNVTIEKKMYPRDPNRDYQFQGRIRVQLKDENGQNLNSNYPTRESVMLYVADCVPKLKSRQQRSAGGASEPATSSQSQQKPAAGGGNKKKKR